MDMTVDVEQTEHEGHVDLAITVPGGELETRKDAILANLRDRVAFPGFRKGHVPKAILEKHFGPQAAAEGLDDLLKEAIRAAFEKQKLAPVDAPKVSDIKMDDGTIRFRVCVEVRPQIQVTDEQILRIPLAKPAAIAITEDDLTAAVDNERKTQSSFSPLIEVRPVQRGDFVVVDYEGFLKDGDAAIDGGKAEGTMLEIGSGRFLPGFDDQMLGMNPGAQKRVDIVFPADFYDDALQGKAAYFHVKLQSIKKRQMPEATDEWAKEQGYESLAEMRKKIKDEMERGASEMAKEELRRTLATSLDERIQFEPPKSFVARQAENLIQGIERQYKGGKKELLEKLAAEGKTEADLEADVRARARRQVKNTLILDAIAKTKNIRVTDDDVDQWLARVADQQQTTPQAVRQELEKQDRLEEVRYSILDEKVVQFLLDHADIR